MNKLFIQVICFNLAVLMACQTIFVAGANLVQAATPSTPQEATADGTNTAVDVDEEVNPTDWTISTFDDFAALDEMGSCLDISPQDSQAIGNNEVDVRTIRYLNYLVTPTDNPSGAPGAGLCPVKVQRLVKNYSSNGIGQYDREGGVTAEDEDAQVISSHHRGQAIDISEVGAITCKLVKKRHIGGSSTSFLPPKPVKVAWQSVDGIANHPTPKSPSLMETSSSMSADAIMQMMNESGELDQTVDFMRGLDLPTMLSYVGANIFLKDSGATKLTGDPLSDNILNAIGISMLEKSMPNLPEGMIAQENNEDVRIAEAKAKIEVDLNLPPGSLSGYGWKSILQSTGKRQLEDALGLPVLYLDDHTLKDLNGIDTVQAALKHFKSNDPSFDFIKGTLEKIKAGDTDGLRMAGVNALGEAFHLSDTQRSQLEKAVLANQEPNIDPASFPAGKNTSSDLLKNLFSENPTEQDLAKADLKDIGFNFFREAATKLAQSKFQGVDAEIITKLLSNKKLTLEDVKKEIGINKLGIDLGFSGNDLKSLTQSGKVGKAEIALADQINKDYGLTGADQISPTEVDRMLSGKNSSAIAKIGGAEADRALGWSEGTGYKVITKQVSIKDAAGEIFANAFGQVLGLDQGTNFSLNGSLQQNYGQALLDQRLGLDFKGKGSSADFDSQELLSAFGLESGQTLESLKANQSYWLEPDNQDALALSDARLGVANGTSEKFLKGELTVDQMRDQTARDNIKGVAINSLWSYFDLDDQFRLDKGDSQTLIDSLASWNNQTIEQQSKLTDLIYKVVGRSMDSKTNFALNFFAGYLTNPDRQAATDDLINQGVRQLATAFGVNLEKFDESQLKGLTEMIIRVYNNEARPGVGDATKLDPKNPGYQQAVDGDKLTLIKTLVKATKIPDEYKDDAAAFVNGDFRRGISAWSAAMWEDFAAQYLPEGGKLSYEEVRDSFIFEDQDAILDYATSQFAESADFNKLPPAEQKQVLGDARRDLMNSARQNTEYKLSDAFIAKASGEMLPPNFTKTMFTGNDKERGDLLLSFTIGKVESALKLVDPAYEEGTLLKVFKGELSSQQADSLVLSVIGQSGASFGEFDNAFIQQFYTFLKGANKTDFYTNDRYSGMWQYMDNWMESKLGVGVLPEGASKSIYYASQHGWKTDAGISVNGQVVVPTLSELGESFLTARLSQWGDKTFGLPSGSTYQIYQAVRTIDTASKALVAAHAAQDAAKLASASKSLGLAQKQLVMIAITIALNACAACQQAFASVDQAIAAPPGFTNAAVAGVIAMSLGLGPAGLIAAAAIYAFGVYRVDYLCPIPPPDRYASTDFDSKQDQLNYKWGDYYTDETVKIKDNPKPGTEFFGQWGENPFDWDDGLPFKSGNDNDLWRAWSRYQTGRLLDATMSYGELLERPYKPLQVITYRRANAEFFFDRIADAFGEVAFTYPDVGLGYTQDTTKTTDWVHVSFGGIF